MFDKVYSYARFNIKTVTNKATHITLKLLSYDSSNKPNTDQTKINKHFKASKIIFWEFP